jgi:hypothetical protein
MIRRMMHQILLEMLGAGVVVELVDELAGQVAERGDLEASAEATVGGGLKGGDEPAVGEFVDAEPEEGRGDVVGGWVILLGLR